MRDLDITPQNHQEVYEFYSGYAHNKRIQNLGFAVMHMLYKASVHFRENAQDELQSHLVQGGSVIVAPNHQSNADTPSVAGLIFEPPFDKLRGNIIAPGKASLFKHIVLSKFFTDMGIHPTFRRKDFGEDEDDKMLREKVTDSLIGLNISFINSGGSVVMFPEGTRNPDNPRQVQQLRRGIGRIATGVEDPQRLRIVTLGVAYRSPKLNMRPLVVVNNPFSPEGMNVDQVLECTRLSLESVVSEAFDRAR